MKKVDGNTADGGTGLSYVQPKPTQATIWRRVAMHSLTALFCAGALIGGPSSSAMAKYASFVIDANTGKVLHATNADTRNYPASLTKIMTLYMVFEALDQGRLTLDTRLKVSAKAARQPSSRLDVRRGQTITVETAILALSTKSANDVAVVVAEALGGSERKFAQAMTATARKIGMTRTTFRNASGLPNRGQLSTARDMATLARALLRNHRDYYHYFSKKSFKYKGKTYSNHNKLLKRYKGADGIKTGYIRASGFNLVASAERNGRRLIGVVFGGNSSAKRNRHMASLLDKGFAKIGIQLVKSTPKPSAKGRAVAAKGQWGVQVGAFYKYNQAREAALDRQYQVAKYLKSGFVTIEPLKNKRGRTVHRARVVGLSKKAAYRACRSMKSKRQACMVLRLRGGLEVAAKG